MRFYVYIYRDPETHIPFYVGKGSGSRKNGIHPHGWCGKKLQKLTKKNLKPEVVTYANHLTEKHAFALERILVKRYGRRDIGTGILLNNTDGGEGPAGVRFGPRSEEHRRHISEAKKGKPGTRHTEDFKRKLSERLKGKPKSAEHNRKNAESHKGKKATQETRKLLSDRRKGKAFPLEARKKTVAFWTGHKHTEEAKAKISLARSKFTGWKHSEETRRKMSDSAKRYIANKKGGTGLCP
jgi:hypothetical protein